MDLKFLASREQRHRRRMAAMAAEATAALWHVDPQPLPADRLPDVLCVALVGRARE